MTLREEITKARQKFWEERDIEQIGGDLDTVIDRLDVVEEHIKRIETIIALGAIPTPAIQEPLEPFPGCNELVAEVIPVLKAAIAKKKRELAQEVVPMTKSKHPED